MAHIRYFAGAAEAAGTHDEDRPANTVGDLVAQMEAAHGAELTRVLTLCSLLVNGTRADDPAMPLGANDQVDVLPPFAGG